MPRGKRDSSNNWSPLEPGQQPFPKDPDLPSTLDVQWMFADGHMSTLAVAISVSPQCATSTSLLIIQHLLKTCMLELRKDYVKYLYGKAYFRESYKTWREWKLSGEFFKIKKKKNIKMNAVLWWRCTPTEIYGGRYPLMSHLVECDRWCLGLILGDPLFPCAGRQSCNLSSVRQLFWIK